MIKKIINFDDYEIDDKGNVYSLKWGKRHQLTPWLDSKQNYLYVSLSKNNQKFNIAIHRLVAQAFLPNYKSTDEVDHINKNKLDNRVEKLRWYSHKEKLFYSYSTMSSIRNYKVVDFLINDKHKYYFQIIKLACEYGSLLGYSYSSLQKYKKTKILNLYK